MPSVVCCTVTAWIEKRLNIFTNAIWSAMKLFLTIIYLSVRSALPWHLIRSIQKIPMKIIPKWKTTTILSLLAPQLLNVIANDWELNGLVNCWSNCAINLSIHRVTFFRLLLNVSIVCIYLRAKHQINFHKYVYFIDFFFPSWINPRHHRKPSM